jgi:hypothetical protein
VSDTSTQLYADSGSNSSEPLDPQDIDVDVDTDIDVDIDIDVLDIETDIDTDIDTDTDTDTGLDPSDLVPSVNSRWESYWAERSTLWAELQSQSA